MASKSKIDKLLCEKLNKKQRYIAKSEVCAKNIAHLSNNDVKTVLSKYSFLSLEEKNIVKQFCEDLKLNNFNRYYNLSKFFKKAFDFDNPVKNNNNNIDKATVSVNVAEKNFSKDKNVLILKFNKAQEQNVITHKSSTTIKSIEHTVKQESTTAPFHTNIITNRVSKNIVSINPLYSTIFPIIHKKVLNQCFSSVLPEVVRNSTINNITAVLNITHNLNSMCDTANNQINTVQNDSVKSVPSNLQSTNFVKKVVSQNVDISNNAKESQSEIFEKKDVSQTTDNKNEKPVSVSNKQNLNSVKHNEKENSDKSRNRTNSEKGSQSGKGKEDVKDSRYNQENKYNKSTDNNNKKDATTKNISTDSSTNCEIEPKPSSSNVNEKVVQDLESFSMEYMKKIENFAQNNGLKNSIKFNLSSNSQIKISETYSKIKQHTESKLVNLNGIKPYFDNTEINSINTELEALKESEIIKTSYNIAKRLIADDLRNNDKNVKSKAIKNFPDNYKNEKPRSHRKNAPSNSDFLNECNFLKSIISKNSNGAENCPKKKEKMEVVLIRKSKKKRKKNKSKGKEQGDVKRQKLDDQPVLNKTPIPDQKNKIHVPATKPILNEQNVIKKNVEQIGIQKKQPQKREVKVVNRVLRNDSRNDQIIKSISEKPFSEECNKITNDTILVANPDVKCKLLEKTMDTGDLMVLLKYFYKLDGLEQHRLIEFLKELELTEPERVAELRTHVRTVPPENEDSNVLLPNPQPEINENPIEVDERPESRNSDLSNIDLILEDIDSILNDEDEESSTNKEESAEPPLKRLKTDLKSNEPAKNDTKSDSTIALGKTIPVQFRNSQNFTYNQNFSNYSNNTIQYNHLIQQNINYITAQSQNYGFDPQNQYFQNNFQQPYQMNAPQLLLQNQCAGLQTYQEVQNYYYNYDNQSGYQQNYLNYQNDGYYQ